MKEAYDSVLASYDVKTNFLPAHAPGNKAVHCGRISLQALHQGLHLAGVAPVEQQGAALLRAQLRRLRPGYPMRPGEWTKNPCRTTLIPGEKTFVGGQIAGGSRDSAFLRWRGISSIHRLWGILGTSFSTSK